MLTQRAALTALATLIDQVARIIVMFALTPVLLAAIGPAAFGYWQSILRVSSILSALDGRANETLKWELARGQLAVPTEKRRIVGSAVLVWATFLPIILVAVVVASLFIANFLDSPESLETDVRLAMLLVGLGIVVAAIAGLFQATLRGTNLGHKRMGVMAAVTVCGGLLTAYAATCGYGLPGIATAYLVTLTLGAIVLAIAVKRFVPWIGVALPTREEYSLTFKRTIWFAGWSFVETALFLGDVVILGYFANAKIVTQYVITSYGAQILVVLALALVGSILPGIGLILERNELEKVAQLRRESIVYSWLLVTAGGAAILLVNSSLVDIWVGSEQYPGHLENLLIVVVALQAVFIRADAAFINLALDTGKKVKLGAVSVVLTVGFGSILVPEFGIAGLCISLLLGRMPLTIIYPRVIAKRVINIHYIRDDSWLKTCALTMALYGAAWYIGTRVHLGEWWIIMMAVLLSAATGLVLCYNLGLPKETRNRVLFRLRVLFMARA